MTRRFALLVDVAFLWASVGEVLFDTNDRSRLNCNYESLIPDMIRRASAVCGRELLRVYWYDGAINKVPTAEQRRVGLLPDVKLRLGRIVNGHQKGVDCLIVLDLVRLAEAEGVDTIFVVSGDDDLTEAVREAQARGVRVVLLGAATQAPRQSEAMVVEADGVELWDSEVWSPHFSLAAGFEPGGGEDRAALSDALQTFDRNGYAFAKSWLDAAADEDVDRVLRSRPRIPADVDARLLWGTSAGRDLSESERVALRDGFWRAFDDDLEDDDEDEDDYEDDEYEDDDEDDLDDDFEDAEIEP